MAHIITGAVNSGKTSELLRQYHMNGAGGGFYLPKIFAAGEYAGQMIKRLGSQESRIFSLIKKYTPENWEEQISSRFKT